MNYATSQYKVVHESLAMLCPPLSILRLLSFKSQKCGGGIGGSTVFKTVDIKKIKVTQNLLKYPKNHPLATPLQMPTQNKNKPK